MSIEDRISQIKEEYNKNQYEPIQQEKEKEYSPKEIDLVTDIPNSPFTSILTGLARAIILYPLYFWFRSPIKLFRPIRVDYLDLARALVPPESLQRKRGQVINFRNTSIGLLSYAINKKGVRFIPNYVLPPMLINSFIGVTLFATYDQSLPLLKNNLDVEDTYCFYLAGALAGFNQAIIATPFDSIKIRMETKQLLDGKHRNISHYYKHSFIRLGITGAYRGFLFTALKDALGFSMFFGLFENSKRVLSSYYNIIRIPEKPRTWYEVSQEGSIVVASGIIAGAGFQLVDYPLERIRTILLVRAAKMELNQPYFKKLYTKSFKHIKQMIKIEGYKNFFYKGFATTLYKAVPSTALGFVCYELLSNKFGLVKHNFALSFN